MDSPPTVEEFQERFTPTFDDDPEEQIQALLEEASQQVDDSWLANDQRSAVMYLTAHWLTLEKAAAEGGSSGVSAGGQQISSESFGPISVSYATGSNANASSSSGGDASLDTTYYGQRYLDLRTKNFPGIVVV